MTIPVLPHLVISLLTILTFMEVESTPPSQPTFPDKTIAYLVTMAAMPTEELEVACRIMGLKV